MRRIFWFVWDVMTTPLRILASAVGFYSPACGHWHREFIDGLCFNCMVKRSEQRAWEAIINAFANSLQRFPIRPFWSQQDQPTQKETIQ